MRRILAFILLMFAPVASVLALSFDILPNYQDEGMKLFVQGTQKVQEGDFIQAIDILKRAVKLRPDMAEGFHNLGYAYEKTGDYVKAMAAYERAINIKPNYASALNNLGFLIANVGKDLNRAINLCQKAVEFEPTSANFRDSLGWACYKAGRIDEAVRHFQTAAQLDPGFAKARFNLGLVEFTRKNFAAAAREFAAAIQINPNFLKAYIPLANCYEKLQMNNKALFVYQQALTKAPDASPVRKHLERQIKRLTQDSKSYYFSHLKQIRSNSKLTDFMQRKDKAGRSILKYNTATDMVESNTTFTPVGIPNQNMTSYDKLTDSSQTIRMSTGRNANLRTASNLRVARELTVDEERELQKRYSLCHSYVERGLVQEAAAELEKIIAVAGDSGIGRQARNELLRVKKIIDEQNRDKAETHLMMGKEFFRAGKYDLAEAEMNKALKLDPSNAEAYKDLALLHYNLGRYKEAYEESKRAIALDRTMKEAYIVLGSLYSKKGRIEDALRTLRKIRELPGRRDAVDDLADRMITSLEAET